MFNHSNVQYNFVIEGDGTIFEGLSWNCSLNSDTRVTDTSSILVAFTGDSEYRGKFGLLEYEITGKQYAALKLFTVSNVINRNLSPSYQLIPHCCIHHGRFPGKWVYSNLTRFEKFLQG